MQAISDMRRRVSLGEHSVPGAKVLLSLLELHFGGITVCCCTEPSKGNVVLLIRRRAVGREGLLSAVHFGCEHGRHGRERADSGGSLPVWLPMIAATRPPSCTLTNRRPKCGQASCIRHKQSRLVCVLETRHASLTVCLSDDILPSF
jgi:hypothetical protein